MGGHEHREGPRSSRAGAWEGSDKLKKALEGLATAKGVSQSRIGAVAKLAAQYSKFYKHVVHDIEVFLWKAEVEHRLAGLYAIDAIIRQSHAKDDPKDAYVKRFFVRLSDTIAAVKKVPEQFQPKVRHVIEEWQKRGIYTSSQIVDAGGREYLSQGQDGNTTSRASPGKLASLLSIIKQKKEEQEHSGDHQGRPPYEHSLNGDRCQADNAGAYDHRSYAKERTASHLYDSRDVGGIMGDAPGVPVGSGRVRRVPDDRLSDVDDRDAKKARGSRWGPPKLDNPLSNDRPAPIITSLVREVDYHADSGRPGYSSPPRQLPLLQSSHAAPPRYDDWSRNVPPSRGVSAGWPHSDSLRSSQPGSLGEHNASPCHPVAMPRPSFPGSSDRQGPGNRVPGTSGEICRNFLAARCTFGDRCWHIHDPQGQSGTSRAEMAESRRKTVLCSNYPLGTCRFGDNCSFAHGEDKLDKSTRLLRPPVMQADHLADSRWQAPPSAQLGMDVPPRSHVSPSAPASSSCSSQARSYGAPQAVYNEPHGDRGTSASVSFANVAVPSPGGQLLPSDHQSGPMTSPQGYPGAYAAASSTFVTQGSSHPNGVDQGRDLVPGDASVVLPPGSGSSQLPGPAAATPATKVLADDDDADIVEPEFTLEYDDDD
uniref:C3H1-type domain-containing protein n=1 Tax=Peronospora matthiolae TaxID=2874970 RepID=A0AAV1UNU8_9STRA